MFDLEEAISEWRRQMLSAGIHTPAPLEELENHLREEVERRILEGSAPQEAFAVAVQKVGQPAALEAEFSKIGNSADTREHKQKFLWLMFCALAYVSPLVLSAPKPWSGMNPVERWLGLAAVALTVGSIFSGFVLHRFLPAIPNKKSGPAFNSSAPFRCLSGLGFLVGRFCHIST